MAPSSAHDELDEVLWKGDPIAGEGDTRTDPYFAEVSPGSTGWAS